MPSYDGDLFSPPAPLVHVMLRNPDDGQVIADVPMLLDTGADVTLLLRMAVAQLNISPDAQAQYEIIGFDGKASLSPVVELEMMFLEKTFRGRFLLLEQQWGIIGRIVLNSLALLFNGPSLVWELSGGK
jgi:predicted aspartyl protease